VVWSGVAPVGPRVETRRMSSTTDPSDGTTHAHREAALDRAHAHAASWLRSQDDRPVPARQDADAIGDAIGRDLPTRPSSPEQVVELLATSCEPGLTAMPSGRFFGFVIGGTHPAGLAADWLVGAWDQNAAMRAVTPAVAAVEEVAGRWLVDLLGLPAGSAVGFATGATTANQVGVLCGRDALLRDAGWDPAQGLSGGPAVRVLAGAERHDSVDLALRYAGLPRPQAVAADDQGRIVPSALAAALAAEPRRPTLVLLQAGNLHSGACDDFPACIPMAREHGAWVHVDGAFGLWAGASSTYQRLVAGVELADSWATDAHKTLNAPYDCGVAVVRDPGALAASMGIHGDYLIQHEGDPFGRVLEMSRRARGIPVWAVLRSLGRSGVEELVDRLCRHAQAFAEAIGRMPGAEVVNDVVFTQVCATFGDDARTQQVVERVLADGTAWASGSRWRGRAVLRISVSNASTTDEDVERTVEALRRAASA